MYRTTRRRGKSKFTRNGLFKLSILQSCDNWITVRYLLKCRKKLMELTNLLEVTVHDPEFYVDSFVVSLPLTISSIRITVFWKEY